VVRTGCRWRCLSREYPPWPTVSCWLRRWRPDGTWERLTGALGERLRATAGRDPQPSAAILDSQSVKATGVGGARGYDGAKELSGRKRHLLVDTLGPALRAGVHGGIAGPFPRPGHARVDRATPAADAGGSSASWAGASRSSPIAGEHQSGRTRGAARAAAARPRRGRRRSAPGRLRQRQEFELWNVR
jgi:transposase